MTEHRRGSPLAHPSVCAAFLESLGVNSLSALRRKLQQQLEAGPFTSPNCRASAADASAATSSTADVGAVLVLRSAGPAGAQPSLDSGIALKTLVRMWAGLCRGGGFTTRILSCWHDTGACDPCIPYDSLYSNPRMLSLDRHGRCTSGRAAASRPRAWASC